MLFKGINYPLEVLRAQESEELVIFAGAGVSVPKPSNLPLFGKLALEIGKRSPLRMDKNEPEDRYLGRLHKTGVKVHEIAARLLVHANTRPTVLHSELLKLFKTAEEIRIVTTNFDTHFSTAAKELNLSCDQFYAPALPLGDDFSGIVYLHGSAEIAPTRCVLTDRDFGHAYLTQGWASRFLASMFHRYTILFVGYSHEDTVMKYLARGLPEASSGKRFAYTADKQDKLEQWRFLGVEALPYPLTKNDNEHICLTDSVCAWVAHCRQPFLEKAERIRLLLQSKPPLDGEDCDFLIDALHHEDTSRTFLQHARGPEWIQWLEKHEFLKLLFDKSAHSTPRTTQIAIWLVEKHLFEDEQEVLAVIQRNRCVLHSEFCWRIWRKIHRRNNDPPPQGAFSRWLTILLAQPYEALTAEHWTSLLKDCRFPEEKQALILLFNRLTQPRIRLAEAWNFFNESDKHPVKVDPEISLLEEENHDLLNLWISRFRPNLNALAHELEPIVTANLRAGHGLLEMFTGNEPDSDPFRFHRKSIHSPGHDAFPKVLDVLVDAAREILDYFVASELLVAQVAIERWFRSQIPILQRLAIYGFGRRSDAPADEKLRWFVQSNLLYVFKEDALYFLMSVYPNASPSSKSQTLNHIVEGPKSGTLDKLDAKGKAWEAFDLLLSLRRGFPACDLIATKLQLLRERHPELAEREIRYGHQPDPESQSTGPKETFEPQRIIQIPPEEFLYKLLAHRPSQLADITNPEQNPANGLAAACKESVRWGLAFGTILQERSIAEIYYWTSIAEGWSNAEMSHDEWHAVLNFAEGIKAPKGFFEAFANVLQRGVQHEKSPLPLDLMDNAERVAEKIWATCLQDTEADTPDFKDWLTTALNRPGGRLAEFWVRRIAAARKVAADEWRGLPERIKEVVSRIVKGSSGASAHARSVILSRVHYFYSLDPDFTRRELLPLFSWDKNNSQAEQCWHGFLYWGRWHPGFIPDLLSQFAKTIGNMDRLPDRLPERAIEHLAGLCLYLIPNPLDGDWLFNVLHLLSEDRMGKFAATIDRFLSDSESDVNEKIWTRWLRDYWIARSQGIPKSLSTFEANEMATWGLSLGSHFPEVVDLTMKLEGLLTFENSPLLYQVEKKGIANTHPDSTAKLLLLFARRTPRLFFPDENLESIWKNLRASKADAKLLEKVRDAFCKLGQNLGAP